MRSTSHSLRLAAAFLLIGIPLSLACLHTAGPLPMDITITHLAQNLFGQSPQWAEFITSTAKHPLVWITLLLGCGLAWLRTGIYGPAVVCCSFITVKILDGLLRAFIYVPKPLPELVPVATVSSSSGLPSTFALVYGAIFGAVLLARPQKTLSSTLCSYIAMTLLIAGCIARVVLGGHWMSQMLACTAISFALVLVFYHLLYRRELSVKKAETATVRT